MAHSPATIAAPANATQVVNSEEPVIVFATEERTATEWPSRRLYIFSPSPGHPSSQDEGLARLGLKTDIKRGHNVHAQTSPHALGADRSLARACAFCERRRYVG